MKCQTGTLIPGQDIRKAVKSFFITANFPPKRQRKMRGRKHNVSRETLRIKGGITDEKKVWGDG
jgi:hypothetical protein